MTISRVARVLMKKQQVKIAVMTAKSLGNDTHSDGGNVETSAHRDGPGCVQEVRLQLAADSTGK